ncbi:MAG: NAD(P)H-binding protein [Chryseolinea sp.]
MKKVFIIGASGGLASFVIEAIQNAELTLFVRNKSRLSPKIAKDHKVIEGDAIKYDSVKNAIAGHDIVYVNLAGNLEVMGKNIVKAMKETGVKRIIVIQFNRHL